MSYLFWKQLLTFILSNNYSIINDYLYFSWDFLDSSLLIFSFHYLKIIYLELPIFYEDSLGLTKAH